MHDLLKFFIILVVVLIGSAIFFRIVDWLFDIWRQRLRIKRIKLMLDLTDKNPYIAQRMMEENNDDQDGPEGR